VPAEVQAEIARREKEVAVAMQEASESRKFRESCQQTHAPYRQLLPEGAELKAIGNLFQTATALQTGSPQQKAHLVAQIIQSYGVPIEALDDALTGKGGPPPQTQAPAYKDPRVDELLSKLSQAEAQRAHSLKEKSLQTVNDFAAKAEFFEDVREEVADMLEVAARRGRELSLEDAYTRAVKLHPELSQVMAQREAAEKAKAAQASTLKARAAASSVRSAPTAPSNGAQSGGSVREALEAALARTSGR
jgi:hypothetical protein